MRITFERGVPSAAAQLAGGGLVVGASAHSLAWWVGWALLAFGVCLLLWGGRWDGRPWWQAVPKLRNPFHRHVGSLYTGRIVVSGSELDQKHFFDVSINAFNGTCYAFQTATIEGKVRIDFSLNGGGQGGFDVRPPVLYFETEKPHKPDQELSLGTRLFLEPNQVAEFKSREAAGQVPQIMFQELDINLETNRGKRMRLPLWDGVSLNSDRLVTGRIVCVVGHATARVSA